MANAKFFEDNAEIAYDRYYMENTPSMLVLVVNLQEADAEKTVIKTKVTIKKGEKNAEKKQKSKKKKSPVVLVRKCKCCGKNFSLREDVVHWYRDKGLSLPLRCEDCRKASKKAKEEKENV